MHVLTTAKLQALCIHMRWRLRNALCSIKNNDLEEMVSGLFMNVEEYIADDPLLTEVMKKVSYLKLGMA